MAANGVLHGQLRPACSADQYYLLVRVYDAQWVRGEDHPGNLRHAQHDRVPHGCHGAATPDRHYINTELCDNM